MGCIFFESLFRKVPTLSHNNSARMLLICYIYTYNIISTRGHVRVYVVWRLKYTVNQMNDHNWA